MFPASQGLSCAKDEFAFEEHGSADELTGCVEEHLDATASQRRTSKCGAISVKKCLAASVLLTTGATMEASGLATGDCHERTMTVTVPRVTGLPSAVMVIVRALVPGRTAFHERP